jgi:2,4-dienoyl-CoA reductase-like NADH-dependent reductase (Old Yellow Enzyme family)/thioredoxin reductase
MPPLGSFLIEKGGFVTHKTIEHYRMRAAGGPAMVVMEACSVTPEGIVSHHQARIDDDRLIDDLSKIARVIKSEGAVPALQVHHAGRQTSARTIGRKPFAPSHLKCPTIQGEVEPLTIDGIQELVVRFADGAERARQAGFELVEVHGAHGYLINQFLSSFSNVRTDKYGGDVQGRTRFAKEIVLEIRKRLGDAFPLSFKISAQEFVPGGLNNEESIEILNILIEAGIDIVQISAGNDATPEWISQPMFMKKACLADSAARIKKGISVPVMVVGRINHPSLAEEIIKSGKADLVCMGRGLLADPEMPKKAREGRLDDIRSCIACNTCIESIFKQGSVECLVNPSLGREEEMTFRPAERRKKVMVVGGGPGGLGFAWLAAQRGHDVHLFERQSHLGGQLLLYGSVTSYKSELKDLIEFQVRQNMKFSVHSHVNHEVTVETVKDENPDVIVVATGSSPVIPNVEGIDREIVCSFADVFNGGPKEVLKTVVIGGGATGCEVAYHLAECGNSVTIVEMLPTIAAAVENMTRKVLVFRLKEMGVRMMAGYRLSKVEENGVTVTGTDGEALFIEAERVVIAIGARPDNSFYEQIKSLGYDVHRIGDCLEPRGAKAAIYEGAVLAGSI